MAAIIISSNNYMTALHNPFHTCSNVSSSPRRSLRAAGRTNSAPHHHFSYHVSNPANSSLSTVQDPSFMKSRVNNMKPFLRKDFCQNDYHQVLSWWEQLELSQQKHQHFRDQPMRWFAWSMGMLPDPQFSMQRIEFTKVIALIYVIDDYFDLIGSLEELALFTNCIQRWDDNSQIISDSLPAYLKYSLHALYTTTNEIADLVMKEHGLNPIDSLRKLWASLFQAFLVEAQWFRGASPPPSAKEYLENAVISCGVHVMLVHLNFLLGNEGNRKNIIVPLDDEKITLLFSRVALIFRLWDDVGSAEDENQDGFDGSYVDYYMKEHDVSLQTAREHTIKLITDAFRDLKKELHCVNRISSTMKKAVLNMVSMIKIMYVYEDQRIPIDLEE